MKKRMAVLYVLIGVSLVTSCCVKQATRIPEEETGEHSTVETIELLQDPGGRVSWLHSGNVIAFDKKGKDRRFDVYVMQLDGSHVQCLTCDTQVPQLNNGNPVWHPSGSYIVFQAQDPALQVPSTPLADFFTTPGIGINNNLWIMTADGSTCWQLTHVKDRHGTLHPQFSPDGKKLLWSEVTNPSGKTYLWAVKLADFTVEGGEPRLTNVQTLQPLDLQLYETHGFSPDGTKILFSGVEKGEYYYDMEICLFDMVNGETVRLTDNDEWDEHAHFTPDGKSIIWVSSEGIPQVKGDSWEDTLTSPPRLDYWIMNADGSNKRRLTWFNDNDSNTPAFMSAEDGICFGDFDIGPDGKTIVAKVQLGEEGEIIVLITFNVDAFSSHQ